MGLFICLEHKRGHVVGEPWNMVGLRFCFQKDGFFAKIRLLKFLYLFFAKNLKFRKKFFEAPGRFFRFPVRDINYES